MSYAKVLCATLVGVGGHLVEVEAYLAAGLPAVILTGLPDSALYEARERVRAAIVNSGAPWPSQRISVNLLPAYIRKSGSAFDLAMALAVLGGADELPMGPLAQVLVIGELGLDGTVLPVHGVLPMVAGAARVGVSRVIAPAANAAEAALVPGVRVMAVGSLREVIQFARGERPLGAPPTPIPPEPSGPVPDLVDVAGQSMGRVAIEVAAAGGHHVAFFGLPGGGKTMLAQRLPSLLPDLDDEAALEVTSLHSVAGKLAPGSPLIRRPPIQAPHHTASVAALVGGGSGLARPGALSLAHMGCLLLDEAPEFSGRALDALRQPLEEGQITLGRSQGVVVYPARIQLVLTANPCACGQAGDRCECPPFAKRRYLRRLTGPLLDRIDIQLELFPLKAGDLMADSSMREASQVVAKRVAAAREASAARWGKLGWSTNAAVPGRVLRDPRWRMPAGEMAALRRQLDTGRISARGYDRILRLAWTAADLLGNDRPGASELDLAIKLRVRAVDDVRF
ncbi:YifB family Mg chelatase-like AAA ATPase [Allorhizocola rhizosphaerae]|uniref:YifB family Mg chelatase-like AAA ATPase n=1 Tax=Allorhizocola rhizosphaerae TaxID=1872709 RepID=UPI000E3DDCF3|nr:YifB family Mg chelatase-like AAA ATPase [Allorhizocola rhizosphaerae]